MLIDCDTLLCKPLNAFFREEFDVCYTWKEDGYPLNTGVILARMTDGFRVFLAIWNEFTQSILSDPVQLQHAIQAAGGADQQALAVLAGRRGVSSAHRHSSVDERRQDYDGSSLQSNGKYSLRLLGINCRFLNEPHSCPFPRTLMSSTTKLAGIPFC